MIKFLTIFMLLITVVNSYALIDSTQVLTPGYENSVLAKIDGKDVKEFDVFGVSSLNKLRNKMSRSKRTSKIQDHILDVIFQTEGNTPEVINTKDYKRNYKLLSEKVAVDLFREDLIKDKFKEDLKKTSSNEINIYIKKILDSLKISHGVNYNEQLLTDISKIKITDPFKYADSLFLIGAKKELVTYKDEKITIKAVVADAFLGLKPK